MMPRTPSRLGAIAAVGAIALLATGCAAGADESAEAPEAAYAVDEALQALLPQNVLDAGEIVVGAPYTLPPSIGIDPDGGDEPVGISPDLAVAFSQILGVDFVWRETDEPIPALQSGAIDLSMGFLSDSAARQEVLIMIDQMQNQSSLLVLADNEDVTDIASLCGSTLAVVSGSQQEVRAAAISDAECGSSPIEILPFAGASDAMAQVQSGRAAAFAAPNLILQNVVESAGDGGLFAVTEARYADNPFAMGVALERQDLADAILGALELVYEDGTYAEIMAAHGASDIALEPEQVVINGGGTDLFPLD